MVRSTPLLGGIVISISLSIIISSHNILITAHDDTNTKILTKTNHLRTPSSNRRRQLQDDHKCKWHADQTHYDGCTNNNDIDDQWLDPSIYNLMFHSTSTDCCNTFFQGVENCVVRSDPSCDDYGEESSCVSPGWHADNTERDGCTNGDNYPKEWLDESQISFMFLSTFEECCNIFYQNDDECIKYDKGCSMIDHSNFLPGGEMSNCDTKWLPDTIWNGCTNAKDDYPADYNPEDSSLQSTFFFDTPNECCAAHHKGSRPCQVRDACTDTTTFIEVTNPPTNRPTFPPNECKWHPSTRGNTIEGSDKPQCNYSTDYPMAWNSYSEMYLFNTKEDCCKNALDSDDCDYVAICATDPPTGRPTTTRPSLEPSSSQVPSTLPPSSSPTVTYYVAHHTGECVLDSQSPKPYYITETFTDYYSCCEASHAKEACIASGPLITSSPTSVWPTISPRPTTLSPTPLSSYYVDHFTGICIDITGGKPPHYITETWPDYWTCCDNSFKRDECDGPTRIPTGAPTGTLSSVPSHIPTGEAPSQAPSEIRRPTGNPTTLLWGAYVAFSGPPSFRPTNEDCSNSSWHVEPNAQGCTNFHVHELGLTEPVLLFSSAEECCSYSFESLDCSVRDVCRLSNSVISAEDNIPKENCNKVWHPDIDNMRDGCSNSDFPVSWHQSSIVMLFESYDECCRQFYLDQGNHCKMYDNCSTESPTVEPTSRSSSPPSSPPPMATTNENYWYPDLDIGTCLKHDGTLLQPNLFTTFELCCKFDWMETATCLSLGQSR